MQGGECRRVGRTLSSNMQQWRSQGHTNIGYKVAVVSVDIRRVFFGGGAIGWAVLFNQCSILLGKCVAFVSSCRSYTWHGPFWDRGRDLLGDFCP